MWCVEQEEMKCTSSSMPSWQRGQMNIGVNSLNVLRHQRFLNKVATHLTHVDPSSLPPTSASAKFHSFRVYFQVSCWKNPMNTLNPTHWGWKKENN